MPSVPASPKDLILAQQREYAAILPKHVNLDRFVKSATLAIYHNPKLLECTKESILAAVYDAAELGLDFTAAKGHAYMVPFKNKKTGKLEAKFMPGYRGYLDLCRRSGMVSKIEAHVVYENDDFEIRYGTDSYIRHLPVLDKDPGKPIGAYLVASVRGQDAQFEFMPLAELEKIRKRSRAADEGPWVTDTDEMYRKTVVRRGFKYLPSTPDMDRAVELDNEAFQLGMQEQEPPPKLLDPTKQEPSREGQAIPATTTGAPIQKTGKRRPGRPKESERKARAAAEAQAGQAPSFTPAAEPPLKEQLFQPPPPATKPPVAEPPQEGVGAGMENLF